MRRGNICGTGTRAATAWRGLLVLVMLFALVLRSPAEVELVEDEPVAPPPRPGSVTGRIVPAGRVSRLVAVSRVTGRSYSPDAFDKKSGAFAFRDLPGDARYDVCVTGADGRRYQGIDLDFADARMLRLAALRRRQLKLPPERAHKFSPEDVQWLCAFVAKQESFTGLKRILYVRGHGRRATLLVELMRTREFHKSKGSVVWRVELWYFERTFDGWRRLPNLERVLERRRLTPGDWAKIHIEYYPALSAYVTPEGRCEPIEFKVPEHPDPRRGRPAHTQPQLETRPYVLGLDVQVKPTSRPTREAAPERPAGGSASRPIRWRLPGLGSIFVETSGPLRFSAYNSSGAGGGTESAPEWTSGAV